MRMTGADQGLGSPDSGLSPGLVITLCVSAYTGLTGGFTEMDIHMQSGMVALALVAFRIGWGVLGSHYTLYPVCRGRALFCNQYARLSMHLATRLGALSIIALLVSLLVQISTGLFANDDIFEGPLASWSLMYPASSQQFTRPIFGFLAGSSPS